MYPELLYAIAAPGAKPGGSAPISVTSESCEIATRERRRKPFSDTMSNVPDV